MVKIIVDSTCDLPENIIKDCGMEVIPLRVLLGNEEYSDRETITVDEVYEQMRKGVMPKTSQPSPERFCKVFEACAKRGEDFIYLAFSSNMSGTCNLAQGIVEELSKVYSKTKMQVLDTGAGSTAVGLLALQAMSFCKAGLDYDRLVEKLNRLIQHMEHVFTINDLTWLIKGGRIGKTQGMIGNILNINPILDVSEGNMEVIRKVRGRKKALTTVVDLLEDRMKTLTNQIIGISHADDPAAAKELKEMIQGRLGCQSFIVNKIGSVLGSHLGIGGVGVFFFNEGAAEILDTSIRI